MQKTISIKLLPNESENSIIIKSVIAEQLGLNINNINGFTVLKRSIDARSKQVFFVLNVLVFIDEPIQVQPPISFLYKDVSNSKSCLIIGAGPAGLFAALQLIELGIKPIILERGKAVKERRRDLASITKYGIINESSNYCYGEGGAGTYSDGKLYTRSSKRGNVERILHRFVSFGASQEILIDAHPHIGTNKLPAIISNLTKQIEANGGAIHFNTQLIDFNKNKNGEIETKCADNKMFTANAIILATGHSARDIFQLLAKKQIEIQAKPFALGVRIEHPQIIIDQQQYHSQTKDPLLPPASYSLVAQEKGRGVFSFCMCPGGIIAPAATNTGEIVVNGWSPSKRNNPFANSGMVVQVLESDYGNNSQSDNLSALHFQQQIEQKAFMHSTGILSAPSQRLIDFVENKNSTTLPNCSYLPGINSVMLQDILPNFVTTSLKGALKQFSKKIKNYYTNEAVLVAVESRTSSPVRIPRDNITLMHPHYSGLFPCGEGAGYAGGIMSAAMDGENVAKAVANFINN
jgi:uncharacterized FAD-dependent dehydrogenase